MSAEASAASRELPPAAKLQRPLSGDKVARGQTLIVLEAMKIQHQLKAVLDAEIESVSVKEGQQVSNRTVLVTMSGAAAG